MTYDKLKLATISLNRTRLMLVTYRYDLRAQENLSESKLKMAYYESS